MPNAYVSVDTLKGTGALNISGTAYDGRLLAISEAVSRQVDRYANREFFPKTEVKVFDGNGKNELFIPDLVAVGTLKEDTNLDGTFETGWATTDYDLEPANASPTADWGGPYRRLVVNLKSNGSQDVFLKERRNYQLTGTWGYRQVTKDSARNGTLADGTTGTLTLDGSASALEVGQTVQIESEWCYVTAIAGTAATVERAKNGSTGTAHTGKDVLIVQYPGPVSEAVLIQVARLWKRKDSGFATEIGMPETGQITVFRGLDSDVKELLSPFRKIPVAGFGG